MQNVVDVILDLGFSLREVENEYCKARLNGFKFTQELELIFIPTNTHVDILLEVDRKAKGFVNEAMGLDETKLRIRLENSKKYSFNEIKNEIERLLKIYS